MDLPSADRSFAVIAVYKGLLTESQAEDLLIRISLAKPLNRSVSAEELAGGLELIDSVGIKRIIRTRFRHGRPCSSCEKITYLMPGERSATTPCEHCGSRLVRRRDTMRRSRPQYGSATRRVKKQALSASGSRTNTVEAAPKVEYSDKPPIDDDTTNDDVTSDDLDKPVEQIAFLLNSSVSRKLDDLFGPDIETPRAPQRPSPTLQVADVRSSSEERAFQYLQKLKTVVSDSVAEDMLPATQKGVQTADTKAEVDLRPKLSSFGTSRSDPAKQTDLKVIGEVHNTFLNRDIDGHTVVKLLNSGGMGYLYLAEHKILDRKLVVKTLKPDIANDDRKRARFIREAKSAAKLEHANIVPVLNIGMTENELMYLTMPYIEGCDLENAIENLGPVAFTALYSMSIELASALEFAHRNGVIHRDIKPANIIVDSEGHVHLTDFGLAALDEITELNLTTPGAFIGTPLYMTPESGLTTSDTRLDLYTLGLTLYYAATGVHPFSGARLSELLRRQIHQSIPDPAPLAPDVPRRYWKILSKCLEFQREDRYQTARDILLDLAHVLDDVPLIAQDSHVWRSPA